MFLQILPQDVKKNEIYSVKSLMQTTVGKVAHLYGNSESHNTLVSYFNELVRAYDNGTPLAEAEDDDEL